jgi:hypothetical protein
MRIWRRWILAILASLPVAVVGVAFAQDISSVAACRGCFVGELQLGPNPTDATGQTKILLQDLLFIDPQGLVWKAGAGDVTDGASIPTLFQPIVGGAWEDDFLPAAVIHDHYTNDAHKVRPWRDTAYVFYQAMLVRHVDVVKAKTMYYAVYVFGPHWDKLMPGVPCGHNCVNLSPDLTADLSTTNEYVRPADFAISHGAELNALQDEIRRAELSGEPLSLKDLQGIALEKHPSDAFISSLDGKPVQ